MESSQNLLSPTSIPTKVPISPKNFNSVFSLSEDKMLETVINNELNTSSMDDIKTLVPEYIIRRKKILNYILSILIFLFISSIFFHFSLTVYLVFIIILGLFMIFYKSLTGFDLIKYIVKKVKENPKDKISIVVAHAKNEINSQYNNSKFWLYIIVPIIVPLFIFSQPRIFYEGTDHGYAVRIYTFGVLNYKTAEIPEQYNGKPVVSLRGNTFSDMPLLESIKLPDTIKEIRGQAFKNCISLTNINIPKNLEYLGGGAFANARSIKSIKLPDTLTYLGGEAFYGASSLESIVLSDKLTEIRGDSFEYCISLRSIKIPDGVTRIGGHAFYGDSSLSEVIIGKNSKLQEIGSSAFRQCPNLRSITIPSRTSVNERAFKESPTSVYRF